MRVFWDTNLFIYVLEGHPVFGPITAALRERMLARNDELVTSVMTLGEVQVRPRRLKYFDRAERYRLILSQTSTILPFTEAAADLYAEIRENPVIKAPDAIQLSCAAAAGVELFVTNDRGLQRLKVHGIGLITSLHEVQI